MIKQNSYMVSKETINNKYYYYLNKKNVFFKKERWGIDHVHSISPNENRGYEQCVDVWKILGVTYKVRIWAWSLTDMNKKELFSTGFKKYNNVGEKSED